MDGVDGGSRGPRDRDAEGRARSARPRDGLGRPLPYGVDGVARQPEGVARAPEDALREAQRLLDSGMPFHAHEVLEDAWKACRGTERAGEEQLWRGLAQLAVGLTHAARGNAVGGARLLLRGAERIGPYGADRPYGIDATALADWAGRLAARLAGVPAPEVDPAAEAPRLTGGRGAAA
ncbi:hypothetical protein BJP40_18000 [Streptomyces sp. CC53]|uniref:DUF309 domain-containing protein n=1 Tax=unclassified Streptomyces TaxID=2593676 RepID=UPI0008DE7F59|nr:MULTISPECIES: DUF309 domain-containing protein [unclassified Streptomyces]OII65142.1 hypothetical protein BJP40_18000 [Streptomyces sp. CC53]